MRIAIKRILSILVVGIITVSLFGCTKKTSTTDVKITNDDVEGKLVVSVVDKSSKSPVSDVRVVILGVDNTYNTDVRGQSPEITLKVNKDIYKKYGGDLWQKSPSGSATVIVSKEGYKDYIVFNKAIYPGYSANRLNIELSKQAKNDKKKYEVNIDRPHEIWVQDLIDYCKNIKEDREGNGDSKATVIIKDQSSKAIEGASVIIPELGVKGTTDKSGKVLLKLSSDKEVFDTYPIKKEYMEYTIVALKEGYTTEILFNTGIYKDKENNINMKLKTAKDGENGGFTASYQTPDDAWVQKLIENYKKDI